MISISRGTVIRGGTAIAEEAVSLSVISASREWSCCCVFWDEERLLGRDEERERLRFRPRGAGVADAVIFAVVVVVVVVVLDEEVSGSGS